MRAFVALEVTERVRESLVEFQSEVRSTGADLKLVEKENLHFTVKFLGDITEAQATEAASRIGSLRLQSVEVEVRGAGAFPSPSNPRVVWAGVAHEHEQMVAPIAAAVNGVLLDIGEQDDRPFRAHITLARVRSGRDSRRLSDLLNGSRERSFGPAKLAELKLKSSVLTPRGPVYSDLGVFTLA